jgi:hypothetical protein
VLETPFSSSEGSGRLRQPLSANDRFRRPSE